MDKYFVGDRIVVVDYLDDLYMEGHKGTIVVVEADDVVGIELDDPFYEGHNCAGHGQDGHCRWCYDLSEIELIYPEVKDVEIEPDMDEITVLDTFLSEFAR